MYDLTEFTDLESHNVLLLIISQFSYYPNNFGTTRAPHIWHYYTHD